ATRTYSDMLEKIVVRNMSISLRSASRMINRRHFSQACMAALATMPLAARSSTPTSIPARARATATTSNEARSQNSFAGLKQVTAGVLNVGYADVGPESGTPAILLHGWPYDIHSYVDVAPLLASAGYRVIVPYLRGYGSTNFLSDGTFRNGQQS